MICKAKYYKNNKKVNLLVYDKYLIDIMQYGTKLKIYLKNNLIVN